MRHHQRLQIWQRSHALAVALHMVVEAIPARKFPGLSGQLRRASTSAPANISEGATKLTNKEFASYIMHAIGSMQEVDNHLAFARDAGALPAEVCERHIDEAQQIRRMMIRFRDRLI